MAHKIGNDGDGYGGPDDAVAEAQQWVDSGIERRAAMNAAYQSVTEAKENEL